MAPPIKSNVSIHPRLKAPHLIPALAFSHMLSNLQHPPAICQPCSPPLPKANSPACLPVPCLAAYRRSPFHHPTILSSCRRTLLHSQKLSCPLEVSSCMGKPAEPFSLVLASVVSLLWVQPCESPQGGCHTSLPTRDQGHHGDHQPWPWSSESLGTQTGPQMPCKIPTCVEFVSVCE